MLPKRKTKKGNGTFTHIGPRVIKASGDPAWVNEQLRKLAAEVGTVHILPGVEIDQEALRDLWIRQKPDGRILVLHGSW